MAASRKVTQEEANALAEKHGALYFETSAKDNTNINEAMESLASELITMS